MSTLKTGSKLTFQFLALALLATFTACTQAKAFNFAKDGKPAATVYVVGPLMDAGILELTEHDITHKQRKEGLDDQALARLVAVTELVNHIERITGAKLPVVQLESADAAAIKSPAIVLGEPAAKLGAAIAEPSTSDEAYRLIVKKDQILIAGESDVAVRHGVYDLLYRLGCDWVMPGEVGMRLPNDPSLGIDELDISGKPAFPFRRLWYRAYTRDRGERYKAERTRMLWWLWRQRAGMEKHPLINAQGHLWSSFVKKKKELLEEKPELLALVRDKNGELVRKGPQLEAAHPELAKVMADDIRKTYEANIEKGEWTKDTKWAFPIGPADGLGYSISSMAMSASAGRIDPIVGELDRTDNLILLANRILEDVTKDYPNAHVGYYSYSVHADYPARYKPHPNVVQIFAPINFSRFHSALDPSSKSQAYYRDILKQWGRLAKEQGNVYFYRGYNWNLAENMLPYTKAHIWGEEIPFYHEMGMQGMNVEATKQWGTLGASDYIFMRLCWDPSQDWKELLKEFCQKAYGEGAEQMLQYHHHLIDQQRIAGQEAGSYHAFQLIFDDEWIEKSDKLIDAAMKKASAEKAKEMVRFSEDSVQFLRLYLAYRRAANNFEFAKAQKHMEELKTHWNEARERNSDAVADEAPAYIKRFLSSFVDATVKYSSGEYRMVKPLPDQMQTLFDPYIVGDRLNYQSAEVEIKHPIMTRTFTSTWDAQGLTGLRDGAVWYRFRFDTPDLKEGEALGLLVGGAEDEARVWLNGKLIGGSGRRFSFSFPFDLSSAMKDSGENLLAIQIIRNSKANEIGLGGILRPSFLFAGPQLEKPAPQMPDIGRVLPGGEIEK